MCHECITFIFAACSTSKVISLSGLADFCKYLAVQFHYLKMVYSHSSLFPPSSSFIIFKGPFIKMSIRKSHIDKLPTQLKDMGNLCLADLCQKNKNCNTSLRNHTFTIKLSCKSVFSILIYLDSSLVCASADLYKTGWMNIVLSLADCVTPPVCSSSQTSRVNVQYSRFFLPLPSCELWLARDGWSFAL